MRPDLPEGFRDLQAQFLSGDPEGTVAQNDDLLRAI